MKKQLYVVLINEDNEFVKEYGFLTLEKAYSFIYETIGRYMIEQLLDDNPIQQGAGGIGRMAEGKNLGVLEEFSFRDWNCTHDTNCPNEEWNFDDNALYIRIKTIELKD
jgi:hypothetical protein